MRWLPVNIAARVLYAQIQHSSLQTNSSLIFYSLENGRPTSWKSVANAIVDFGNNISSEPTLKLVSMETWLNEAKNAHNSPAFHLLEFFETYVYGRFTPRLDLKRSTLAAGSLVDYGVREEVIQSYIAFACADVKRN